MNKLYIILALLVAQLLGAAAFAVGYTVGAHIEKLALLEILDRLNVVTEVCETDAECEGI